MILYLFITEPPTVFPWAVKYMLYDLSAVDLNGYGTDKAGHGILGIVGIRRRVIGILVAECVCNFDGYAVICAVKEEFRDIKFKRRNAGHRNTVAVDGNLAGASNCTEIKDIFFAVFLFDIDKLFVNELT
jgi:hypothetical protein